MEQMYVYTLHCAKYNEIIHIVLVVKFKEEIGLPQSPQMHSIFYANCFFYVSQSLEPNFQWQHMLVILWLGHFSFMWIIIFFFSTGWPPNDTQHGSPPSLTTHDKRTDFCSRTFQPQDLNADL